MRYTEAEFLVFLEKLFVLICNEHDRIGKATEAWQSSFRLLAFPTQLRVVNELKKKEVGRII